MSTGRRRFLQATAGALAHALLAPAARAASKAGPGYDLSIFASSWGYVGAFTDYCARIKDAGYDGIEMGWPDDPRFRAEIFEALEKHRLEVGFICIVLPPDGGAQEHLRRFTRVVEEASTLAPIRPRYLDCHSGRDHYSMSENAPFIDVAARVASTSSIPVMHETHRSRMLYAPAVARSYLERHRSMRVYLDMSHWCVVSESLLEDQRETVALAIERTDAISARVGHAQGAQVSDPRAPEWRTAVQAHLAWWDAVVALKKLRGERLVITTEFGPPDYMPTIPYTRAPLADQWTINVYMQQLLRERYASTGS